LQSSQRERNILELHEVDNTIIQKWDEVVYSMPGGTIFHTLKWIKIIEKNQALHAKYIGIYLDDRLIGIFPLFIKKFWFIKVAASPFVVEDTPYMGPVIDPSNMTDLLPALDAYLKKNKIHYLRTISNGFYDVKNAHSSYIFIKKNTHILDLKRTKEELWKNLEGRCRTAIRKAQKSDVVANIMKTRDYIEKYYLIIEEVYHRQNKPCPNSRKFYYDMWDSFGQSNAIFLSAKYSEEIIAGAIIILDRKRAYYLNGASKHEFRSLSASNLLLWEAINIVKERGAEQFDFVGSDILRLAKFKKSFGGQLVAHSLIEKSGSRWVSLLRDNYPYYKQKMGNLRQFFQKTSR
jgi:lipid II:glycine glycyltransferase (peptidoglycan interpeptide bridge formation enzyme)